MKHFGSTNISSEVEYVDTCWQRCLEDKNTLIPAYKLHLYDNKTQQTTTITILKLKFFKGDLYVESDLSIESLQIPECIPEQQLVSSPTIPLPKQKVNSTPKTVNCSDTKTQISDTPFYPINTSITTPSKSHYEDGSHSEI